MIRLKTATRECRSHTTVLAAIGCALLLGGAVAMACDTPVYRYAMYNWTAESYVVVYAYDGEQDASDNAANEQLANAATAIKSANIRFMAIDVSDPDDVQRLPPEMQEALDTASDTSLPTHIVFSPQKHVLRNERLVSESVEQLIASPARLELADLLRQGCAGVLMLLECENKEANQHALNEAESAIARAAAGEIQPYTLGGTDEQEAEQEPFRVGLIVVSRDDPSEQALVSMLLDVEEDLAEFTEPMIFGVYGRARAGWPYLGKGITAENMNDCLAYMSGACSCEVKEQNPGMDLLVAADWDAAAESLAIQFQDDSADEYLQAESLFPVVINSLDDDQPTPSESQGNEQLMASAAPVAESTSPPTANSDVPAPESSSGGATESVVELAQPKASTLGIGLVVVVGGMVFIVMFSSLLVFRNRGS